MFVSLVYVWRKSQNALHYGHAGTPTCKEASSEHVNSHRARFTSAAYTRGDIDAPLLHMAFLHSPLGTCHNFALPSCPVVTSTSKLRGEMTRMICAWRYNLKNTTKFRLIKRNAYPGIFLFMQSIFASSSNVILLGGLQHRLRRHTASAEKECASPTLLEPVGGEIKKTFPPSWLE